MNIYDDRSDALQFELKLADLFEGTCCYNVNRGYHNHYFTQLMTVTCFQDDLVIVLMDKDEVLVYPYDARTVYLRFQANFRSINSTRIAKMFCGRCLVNLIITF